MIPMSQKDFERLYQYIYTNFGVNLKEKKALIEAIELLAPKKIAERSRLSSRSTMQYEQIAPERSQKNEWMTKKEEESNRRKKASKIKRLEEEISRLESAIKKLEADLEVEENSRNAEIANSLFSERTALEAKLIDLMDEWAKCSEGE